MKTNRIILFITLLFFCSCYSWEEGRFDNGRVDPQTRGVIQVQIAENGGAGAEAIKTVRYLVFTDLASMPKVELNEFRDMAGQPSGSQTVSGLTAVLGVSRRAGGQNDKLVVAIVNEPAGDTELTEKLETVGTLEDIANIELKMSHFLNGDHMSFLPGAAMPMTGVLWTDNVCATVEEAQAQADKPDGENVMRIKLQKAVARVDVYMNTNIPGGMHIAAGSAITLSNTYDKSYFVYHKSGGNVLGKIQTVPSAGFTDKDKTCKTWTPTPGQQDIFIPHKDSPTDPRRLVCSFYTPERTCLSDRLKLDVTVTNPEGATREGSLTLETARDESHVMRDIDVVKRNTVYRVTATVGANGIAADVQGWTEMPDDVEMDVFTLNLSGREYDLSPGAHVSGENDNKLTVTTDCPAWTAALYEDREGTVPLSATGWLGLSQYSGTTAAGGNDIWLLAGENTEEDRTAWIHVRAGRIVMPVRVTQQAAPNATVTITKQVILSKLAHNPAAERLTVTCTDKNGNPALNAAWTLTVPAGWLTISDTAAGNAGTTVTGRGTKDIYLFAGQNPNVDQTRRATLNLTYGGGSGEATVIQLATTIPPTDVPTINSRNSYVGAFWRAGQTGERVIKIRGEDGVPSGEWAAMVSWYDGRWKPNENDGVLLAPGASPNLSDPDAEHYQLTRAQGYTNFVSGEVTSANPSIEFRIGLEKTFAMNNTNPNWVNSFPARYAVITLWYGNYSGMQNIYLRQGEGDDYLMSAKAPDYRGVAARFSPYNLTADVFDQAVAPNGVGANPAKWTQYPTQGGAYFQWVGNGKDSNGMDRFRYAYHPNTDHYSPGYTSIWLANHTGTWDNLDESCPVNYQRPSDNTSNLIDSEIRQSLFLNPTSDTPSNFTAIPPGNRYPSNSVFGHYADGFFDRQTFTKLGGKTTGVVAHGSPNVAYGGRLFFNPETKASLFFPVAGLRISARYPGTLSYEAEESHYWTKTINRGGNSAITLGLQNEGFATVFGASIFSGAKVRCVRK